MRAIVLQNLLKAGVGSHGDALKLERDFALQCKGMVCLSEHANARLCGPGSHTLPQKWSLAGEEQSCSMTSAC